MADENLNTNNNEETAALFVSAQKKKKAEEEARQKAAEEQAKRDAAEAEVRRMEQEVEERKRKAEEEKKALEEAQAAAAYKPQQVKEAAMKAVENASEKAQEVKKGGKLPLPAIIGAAAVVVIILIAVFALGGKGGKKGAADSSAIQEAKFEKAYTLSESGFDVSIKYPEELYSEVSEAKTEDDTVAVTFTPAGKKGIEAKASVTTVLLADKGFPLTKGLLGVVSAKTVSDLLKRTTRADAEGQEGVEIVEEKTCDIASDNPGKYFYTLTFKNDTEACSVARWLQANTKGEYKTVEITCKGAASDVDAVKALCGRFIDENNDKVLMIPGGSPLTSTTLNGQIDIDETHLGMPVPDDRFEKYPGIESIYRYTDENGASIVIVNTEVEWDPEAVANNRDIVLDFFRENITKDYGANIAYNDGTLVSRNMTTERIYDTNDWGCAFYQDYDDVIGGVNYWERCFAGYWRDVRTDKCYCVSIAMIAPAVDKTAYQEVMDKALTSLKDI